LLRGDFFILRMVPVNRGLFFQDYFDGPAS
jgi:hypothetical protein